MKRVSKTFDFIEFVIERILIGLMLIFVGIIVVQIVWRYILNSPLTWSEQVSRYLFIWAMLLAIPIVTRKKQDIAFDLLVNKFPEKFRIKIQYWDELFDIGVCSILFRSGNGFLYPFKYVDFCWYKDSICNGYILRSRYVQVCSCCL